MCCIFVKVCPEVFRALGHRIVNFNENPICHIMAEILDCLLSSRAAGGQAKLWEFKYREPSIRELFLLPQAETIILCCSVFIQEEDKACNRNIQCNLLFLPIFRPSGEKRDNPWSVLCN